MVTRVLMQSGLIKVSKPGQDVYTVAERDLLLSIGMRSCQVIQRGRVLFPAGTSAGVEGGVSVATFEVSVPFPAQLSVPDVWVALVPTIGANPGLNQTDGFPTYSAAYNLSFGSSSFYCGGRWEYSTSQYLSTYALHYVVFRKRLTG